MVTGPSDHNLTLIVRKLSKSRFYMKPNTKSSQLRIPKSDMDEFDKAIKNIDWNRVISGENVDTDTQILVSTIQNITKHFLRKTKCKSKNKYTLPWINSDIRKSMKERDNALRSYLKTKSLTDRHIFVSLRNRVTKDIRAAKSNFFINLLHDTKGNHRQIWDCLQKLTGKCHNGTEQLEIIHNGTLCKAPVETATLFNNHFVNSVRLTIHSPQTAPLHSLPVNNAQPVFSLTEVSESKVTSIITSIKNSKSKDIYGLDALLLKIHTATLTGPIAKIINASIKEGKSPPIWKSAIVVPVHKSGDTMDMNNYRPISILPVMSKIFEKCVAID